MVWEMCHSAIFICAKNLIIFLNPGDPINYSLNKTGDLTEQCYVNLSDESSSPTSKVKKRETTLINAPIPPTHACARRRGSMDRTQRLIRVLFTREITKA